MDVYKTNGSYEEYDREKLIRGIHEAYKTAGQECPEAVVISIVDNLYIYDKIASKEIRRQVEESLMSINKKVALAYIEKFDAGIDLRKKRRLHPRLYQGFQCRDRLQVVPMPMSHARTS